MYDVNLCLLTYSLCDGRFNESRVFCRRLLQHAVALRQLTHRNIATIYDAFCADSYTADGVDAGGQTSPVSVYIVQVVTKTQQQPNLF